VENMSDSQIADPAPRYGRQVSDRILVAFHHACDQGDLEVAGKLLAVLEKMLTRLLAVGSSRHDSGGLVAAHERLWNLMHPAAEEYRNFG
jgi:hypothetical protein